MSGIAGVYNLDGRPADAGLLRRMTDVMAHRGPDGVGHWVHGPVGLGQRMLHTTPESLLEQQPLTDESGTLCLTLDGRVDNRDELKAALEAKGARLRDSTDAELVLRAYECWEEECPAKIIGDFAFAIWDGRKRQLFCARDFLGRKPFCYWTDGRRFLFGSELHLLFEDATVPQAPNEAVIGEYLADAIASAEETLFRGIYRLPPAHSLVVQPGRVRQTRYWDFDPRNEVRYRSDAEYVEHFLDLFREAVRCRLRSHGPPAAHLSGGLDSSFVVGMAQLLLGEDALSGRRLETFSLVFPGLPCDESRYIQDVVEMWELQPNLLTRRKEIDLARLMEEIRRYRDFPSQPNGALSHTLKPVAAQKGIRVVLSGVGGDEWLAGSFYHYADLLRQFQIGAFLRQYRLDSQIPAVYAPPLAALKMGLWPLFPRPARRVVQWMLGQNYGLPDYINKEFSARIHLKDRVRRENGVPKFPSLSQGAIYRSNTGGWSAYVQEREERSDSFVAIERRDPFNDRRVSEFALALPDDQRWRGGWTKFLMREAMRGLVPETVRLRRDKADFSIRFAKAFASLGAGSLFDSLEIASQRWVDGDRVRERYAQTQRAYEAGGEQAMDRINRLNHVNQLWMVLGIELWFRSVFIERETSSIQENCLAHRELLTN